MSIHKQKQEYRKALVEIIGEKFDGLPAVAATLTFDTRRGYCIAEKSADETITLFKRRLDRLAFGNASRQDRGGYTLPFVAIREGSNRGISVPIHYHALIAKPKQYEMSAWLSLVEEVWTGLDYSSKRYNQFVEHAPAGEGWVNYITKLRTKQDIRDSLHVESFCFDRDMLGNAI